MRSAQMELLRSWTEVSVDALSRWFQKQTRWRNLDVEKKDKM